MSHKALLGLVVLSIALNILFVGLIGGHMMTEGRQQADPLAWAFKEVPQDIRRKVRPMLKDHARDVMSARRDVRKSERALRKLIQSETLTRTELEAGLADMRASSANYHALIHDVGVDVLMSLSAEQRMKAAPYLFKQPGRQPRRAGANERPLPPSGQQ
jgi:uncharacterized membrane protein